VQVNSTKTFIFPIFNLYTAKGGHVGHDGDKVKRQMFADRQAHADVVFEQVSNRLGNSKVALVFGVM